MPPAVQEGIIMAKFEQYKDKNNKRKWLFSGYIATDPITEKKIVKVLNLLQ